ncbi:MAG: hypothetical protein KDA96_25235 [Planctomycetaceae bacterium]|nr:hypothetical protein [Planctomycetaceae bacterium]MCA9066406.1 hypothetical protein [Planctomycetaceae bacterium]
MRLLIGFVNSDVSLIVYDWTKRQIEWVLPSSEFRSCGLCCWNDEFVAASDDRILRFTAGGRQEILLPGPHASMAHSVHPVNKDVLGVIDTGNSELRLFDRNGSMIDAISPFSAWGKLPADAVHLNDFAVTHQGIVGSCFDHRPWRAAQTGMTWQEWCQGGFGLLLNLDGHPPHGRGAVLACGVNHPHSLIMHEKRLYHCSSATGDFHCWGFDAKNRLYRVNEWKVSDRHFLRGALHADGHWYLGGSTSRHGERLAHHSALFRLHEESGNVEEQELPVSGEIYEVLDWRENIAPPECFRHAPLT